MKRNNVRNLLTTAVLLAVGYVLPLLTGQLPAIGSMLSLLHIPVLLCGLCCGWGWGALLGAVLPLTRSMIFGMPPLFPVATAMAFEMAAYGALSGALYTLLLRRGQGSRLVNLYTALILAMLGGRLVYGAAMAVCMGIAGNSYTFQAFLAGAFVQAWPGILLHLVLIPPVTLALERARLSVHAPAAA